MAERNVTVAGAGRIEGGSYGQVKIAGSGRVVGDLQAEEFKSAGAVKVEGNLKARRLETAGSFRATGSVEVDEGEIAGSFAADGALRAKELKIAGSARAKAVSGGYVRAGGTLKVDGAVEVDTFRVDGSFEIGELLSADKIEVHLEGRARVREMGGERIEVRRGTKGVPGLLASLLFGDAQAKALQAEAIEGDEVYLEETRARVVRGKKVHIGPGCRIDRVEYEELAVHPQAEVGERIAG